MYILHVYMDIHTCVRIPFTQMHKIHIHTLMHTIWMHTCMCDYAWMCVKLSCIRVCDCVWGRGQPRVQGASGSPGVRCWGHSGSRWVGGLTGSGPSLPRSLSAHWQRPGPSTLRTLSIFLCNNYLPCLFLCGSPADLLKQTSNF